MTDLSDIFQEKEEIPIPTLLPEGRYQAKIIQCWYVANKKNTGNILGLTFQTLETAEPHFPKKYINVKHNNKQVEDIGKKELSHLCQVLNIDSLRNTEQFIDKELIIYVTKEKDHNELDVNKVGAMYPIHQKHLYLDDERVL